MSFQIESFSDNRHLHGTIEALKLVRQVEVDYPPRVDIGDDDSELENWLLGGETIERWVAVEDREVIGHVGLNLPASYILDWLDRSDTVSTARGGFAEISKLFVIPSRRSVGVASRLLDVATAASWEMGRQPALAVVDTSADAVRLYQHRGMTLIGEFQGVHGRNLLFTGDAPVADGV
jgi:GNAT superfamily N-acetyltransferase